MGDRPPHLQPLTSRALEVLPAVARHLTDSSDLQTFFGRLTETIGRLVRAKRVGFWLWDGDETIRLQPHAFGFPADAVAGLSAGAPCRVGGTDLVEQIVFGQRRIRLRDSHPEFAPYRSLVDLVGFSDVLSVGWKAGETALGLVAANDSTQPEGFTEDDLDVLELAASAAGLVWLERIAREEIARVGERENARLRAMVAELEKTERKLNEAQAITHLGSWEWDIPNDKITWSSELHRIFGVSEAEFDGTFAQYQRLLHPEDRERTGKIVQTALEQVAPFSFEHRILREDGSIRTIKSMGNVDADANGRPVRMMGTAHDISATRMAEELQLRRLTLLLDVAQNLAAAEASAEILVGTVAAAGELLSRNPSGRARQVSVHIQQEADGSIIGDREVPTTGRPARPHSVLASALVQVLDLGRPQLLSRDDLGEAMARHFGPPAWVSALAVPMVTRGSRAVLVATSPEADFSSEEVDLVDVLGHIARLALSHVEDLAEERDTRSRMEELERVKSEFLRLASHELRGPLAIARGYTSMVLDGTFGATNDRQHREALPMIEAKLGEIHHLVEQMLDAARLEDNRLELEFVDADLNELVREAVASAQQPPSELHTVSAQYPSGPVPVRVDRARMRTVLLNLVGNAIKYSPDGGLVQVKVLPTEDARVLVEVSDEGVGIADADLPRLFTRFGRIVTLDNSHILGSGLGLYLSRDIAARHGGDIVARSVEGRGSTFTLSLPLLDVEL
ncbi:MAG: hypothetical protein NVS9B1_22010 [Candidatus Dormibacteraceae bacterium]